MSHELRNFFPFIFNHESDPTKNNIVCRVCGEKVVIYKSIGVVPIDDFKDIAKQCFDLADFLIQKAESYHEVKI